MLHRPLILLAALLGCPILAGEAVVAERAPAGGIQPQAILDDSGTIHAVWFSGAAAAGNLFYARRPAGAAEFSAPLRVNSEAGSAIALGTIRGAQVAIGRGGRIHVLWNGSAKALPTGPDGGPGMLYSRLAEDCATFEPQRQVIRRAGGVDGGGSIVADPSGHVWAFWHATAGAKDESGRAVYVATSNDDGATFAAELPATTLPTGACGCCGLRAGIDAQGRLYVLYRAAHQGHRDEILLSRGKDQKTFTGQVLDPWDAQVCPMSTSAIGSAGDTTALAWETAGRIFFSTGKGGKAGAHVGTPGASSSKHPTIAINAAGEVLVAWSEGTGWDRGGALAWQRFDARGKPIGVPGRAEGLPAWSLPSAVARNDGTFLILY